MQSEKIWIWQDDNYPHFRYDKDRLSESLLSVSQNSGRLDGITYYAWSSKKQRF